MKATIDILHPSQDPMVLATQLDWNGRIQPKRVSADGRRTFEVELDSSQPYLYFKPILRRDDEEVWTPDSNYFCYDEEIEIYPRFELDFSNRLEPGEHRGRRYWVYLPPGYHENTLKRYPVLYMQDGQDLFGNLDGPEWEADETVDRLSGMFRIDKVILVGVEPSNRSRDYGNDGEAGLKRYADDLLALKAHIDHEYRTLRGRENNAVIGSSLGGLAAFYIAWTHQEHFSKVACLSSAFWAGEYLYTKVLQEPRADIKVYMDSGYDPVMGDDDEAKVHRDGYEMTLRFKEALRRRGFRDGENLTHLLFPGQIHTRQAWAIRLYLPFQMLFGN